MQTNPKKPKLDSLLIAIAFLASGIALLDLSVFSNSPTLCFIGLGLTFWGAIFLLVTPQKQIEGSFLVIATLPAYMTIDRMIKDLKSKNEAYNIPSYTRDVCLPENIAGLKEMVTFIPAGSSTGMAAVEDLAKGKFLCANPKGLLLAPPGVTLLEKIEQKSQTDLTKTYLSELIEILPNMLNELSLTKEIKMVANENDVILEIKGSLYRNLYSPKYSLKSITLLGCPLVNAAACAIAKSTGKPTTIQKIEITPDLKTITATIKTIQS